MYTQSTGDFIWEICHAVSCAALSLSDSPPGHMGEPAAQSTASANGDGVKANKPKMRCAKCHELRCPATSFVWAKTFAVSHLQKGPRRCASSDRPSDARAASL